MNGFRLYLRMVWISVRSQWQYRASFFMHALGHALGGLIEYVGIWAYFDRFGPLGSWTIAEAGMFYGLGRMAFAISEMIPREFDMFGRHVRTGTFDRMLLRPRSTVLQMFGAQIQIMRIGGFLQALVVFILSYHLAGQAWGMDRWLLFCFSILGGFFLFTGLIIMQATSCFWTVESLEIWNSVTYGGVAVIQYPLNIYHKILRYFFTYLVPLVAINYWPMAYLLGRAYVLSWLSWLSPLIGIAFFTLSIFVWRYGVKHYRSTGS